MQRLRLESERESEKVATVGLIPVLDKCQKAAAVPDPVWTHFQGINVYVYDPSLAHLHNATDKFINQ